MNESTPATNNISLQALEKALAAVDTACCTKLEIQDAQIRTVDETLALILDLLGCKEQADGIRSALVAEDELWCCEDCDGCCITPCGVDIACCESALVDAGPKEQPETRESAEADADPVKVPECKVVPMPQN